jgi:hypothetical protein
MMENGYLQDQRDGRIALRWILIKLVVRMRGGWNWLRIMSNGGWALVLAVLNVPNVSYLEVATA